jgi:hypothetical protein
MLAYLFFFGCLAIAAYRPVWGFAIFLMSQTAIAGIVSRLIFGVPHYYGFWAGSIAITVLWWKRSPQQRLGKQQQQGLFMLLVFTGIVFLRQIMVMDKVDLRDIILNVVPYTFLWAPLFGAFVVLTERERELLWKIIAIIAGLVGVAGLAAYLSGSGSILTMFAAVGFEQDYTGAVRQTDILRHRYVTRGLFTLVPTAFWISIEMMYRSTGRSIVWTLLYCVAAAFMIAIMAISVTRNLLMNVALGSVAFLILLMWQKTSIVKCVRTFVFIVTFGILTASIFHVMNWGTIQDAWSARMKAIMYEGIRNVSVTSRLDDSVAALNYALENGLIFGAPGPRPTDNYVRSGDPALPLFVWLWYGFFGMLVFCYLLSVSLVRLCRLILHKGMNESDYVRVSSLTGWSIVYLYQTVAGSYLFRDEIFMLILFISEITRLYQKYCKHRDHRKVVTF